MEEISELTKFENLQFTIIRDPKLRLKLQQKKVKKCSLSGADRTKERKRKGGEIETNTDRREEIKWENKWKPFSC
jgi:hypothetical protein